jgi:hypothetical protein
LAVEEQINWNESARVEEAIGKEAAKRDVCRRKGREWFKAKDIVAPSENEKIAEAKKDPDAAITRELPTPAVALYWRECVKRAEEQAPLA